MALNTPFPIVQRVGKVAYKLQLPDLAVIHPVFHVSRLQRSVKPPHPVSSVIRTTDLHPGAEPRGGQQGPWPLPRLRHVQENYIYSLSFMYLNIYTLNFVQHN
jgi:hypothetical protein